MRDNKKLGWMIVIITLMLFFSSISGFSNAQENDLDRRLFEINSRLAGKKTDTGNLEKECLKLLEEYDSNEDQGRIYSAIAFIYSQSGMIQPEKTVEYCKKALMYPLEIATACQMYVFWTDALQIEYSNSTGQKFASARREIIIPCLTGLKLILNNKIPKEMQEPPAVSNFYYHGPQSNLEYQKLLKKHNDEILTRKRVMMQNKLLQHRNVLIDKCVSLYSRKPYAISELYNFAQEILGNDDAVSEILSAVGDRIKR